MASKIESLITTDMNTCVLCGRKSECIHHIFGGPNRKNSTTYKCLAPLCNNCHNFTNSGVHFNRENDLKLKKAAQQAFEEKYNHDTFMRVFGKNFL